MLLSISVTQGLVLLYRFGSQMRIVAASDRAQFLVDRTLGKDTAQ